MIDMTTEEIVQAVVTESASLIAEALRRVTESIGVAYICYAQIRYSSTGFHLKVRDTVPGFDPERIYRIFADVAGDGLDPHWGYSSELSHTEGRPRIGMTFTHPVFLSQRGTTKEELRRMLGKAG
jgi:hypothetical protein